MAATCAIGFRADRLLFLTDVEGVRGAGGDVVPLLNSSDSQGLIQDGVATGGMQAKLNAAHQALREGIHEVVIAPGGEPDVVARLLAGERIGSRLVP
jgi:acetylglutamate kinase